jgi:hypothetical protein
MRAHKNATLGSFVFTKQSQRESDRRERADGDQRPAHLRVYSLLSVSESNSSDSSAEHYTGAGYGTDLRNGDVVVFYQLLGM